MLLASRLAGGRPAGSPPDCCCIAAQPPPRSSPHACLMMAPSLLPLLPCGFRQFMASPENRSRYWARSFAGWLKFGSVAPNAAHESIARLQHGGGWELGGGGCLLVLVQYSGCPWPNVQCRCMTRLTGWQQALCRQAGSHAAAQPWPTTNCRAAFFLPPACPAGWAELVTQNVDRLHHKAGSPSVLELHGTTHEVICMGCGRISCRHELQELLAALNPDAAAAAAALAAQQDAVDDLQRLLRAGTAAAVHPSLRVSCGRAGACCWAQRGWQASRSCTCFRSCQLFPICPAAAPPTGHSLMPTLPHLPICPAAHLPCCHSPQETSCSSSSGGGGATILQRPDGDAQVVVQRPDGDAEVAGGGRGFRVPPCSRCGGILKPRVVFFGDSEFRRVGRRLGDSELEGAGKGNGDGT